MSSSCLPVKPVLGICISLMKPTHDGDPGALHLSDDGFMPMHAGDFDACNLQALVASHSVAASLREEIADVEAQWWVLASRAGGALLPLHSVVGAGQQGWEVLVASAGLCYDTIKSLQENPLL